MADNTANGVWVLTVEHNEHNQHGSYLCCAWAAKPSLEQLANYFRHDTGPYLHVMAAVAFLLHVQKGGGRQEHEDQWYNLDHLPFGKRFGDDA